LVSLAALLVGSCTTETVHEAEVSATRQPSLNRRDIAAGGVSDDEIVIGVSAAFAGSSRGLGIELYRGSMAYIKTVNAAGGVHGRQIVIQAYDDGYSPTPAIDNTIALAEVDDVFLLFDYVGTPTVTRILPLLKRYSDRSLHLFFPFTGAQPQREPPYDEFVFNLRASYRQETAGLTDNFVAIGRERIAVFYQADAYGRSGWDGVTRALERHGLEMAGEATYRRGSSFAESFVPQVDILKDADAEAVILIGSYQACAGFIRDARDADWDVPIANVSFVGSENLLKLLLEAGQETGKDYTTNLINSQVVPSYEDTSLPAVREYRELMDRVDPEPPPRVAEADYQPLHYSFVSFEGFLNAKLLVEVLDRMGENPSRERIQATMEQLTDLNLGIGVPVSFGSDRHQGLDMVYFTTVEDERFVPLTDWREWQK
jgi:ABC-type branched-subunit amino acid transport system substrate-binding protein